MQAELVDKFDEAINAAWTLNEGVEIAQLLEPICVKHGYHVALNGSVLYRGHSRNDLDIIIYRHHYPKKDNFKWNREAFLKECETAGFDSFKDCGELYDLAKKEMVSLEDAQDTRDVFECWWQGKLVNFFFFNV